MKIQMAGTGAMGATFGMRLLEQGHEAEFVSLRESTVKRLRREGIRFAGPDGERQISSVRCALPEQLELQADWVILFTKSMQLEEMLRRLAPGLRPTTRVLCLLNGLGHQEVLERWIPRAQAYIGITVLSAQLLPGGKISCSTYGQTQFQGLETLNAQGAGESQADEAAVELATCLTEAGIPSLVSAHIQPMIWTKACLNGVSNATCALLDCYGAQLAWMPDLDSYLRAIIGEFVSVAQAEGVALSFEEAYGFVVKRFEPDANRGVHYPSMHQDLVTHKRPTEIDYLNGYVARRAEELGLQAPYCKLITQLIHTKEALVLEGAH